MGPPHGPERDLTDALGSDRSDNLLVVLHAIFTDGDARVDRAGLESEQRSLTADGLNLDSRASTSWAELRDELSSPSAPGAQDPFRDAIQKAVLALEREVSVSVRPTFRTSQDAFLSLGEPVVSDRLSPWQLRRCNHCGRLLLASCVETHLRHCVGKSSVGKQETPQEEGLPLGAEGGETHSIDEVLPGPTVALPAVARAPATVVGSELRGGLALLPSAWGHGQKRKRTRGRKAKLVQKAGRRGRYSRGL